MRGSNKMPWKEEGISICLCLCDLASVNICVVREKIFYFTFLSFLLLFCVYIAKEGYTLIIFLKNKCDDLLEL